MRSIPRLFADDDAVLVGAKSLKQLETDLNFEISRIFIWMIKKQA